MQCIPKYFTFHWKYKTYWYLQGGTEKVEHTRVT